MAGSGFENSLLYANNADFSNSTQPTNANGITADNQVWLGRSAVVGTLSQIDVMTLTAGSGISLTRGGSGVPGTPGSLTIANTGSMTDLHVARYIVSAGGATDGANYTTIATAYAAAVLAGAPQTVFVQPGTYTENLTLTPGINISAFSCDSQTPSVIIVGKLTYTAAGDVSLSGLHLRTNADFALSVTGTLASQLNLINCFVEGSNANAIQFTSSSANSKIEIFSCRGDIASTRAYFTHSAAGKLAFYNCVMENNGASTTAATSSGSGSVNILNCYFANAITTSGTSVLLVGETELHGALIIGGTGAGQGLSNSLLDGATSSAVSIGAGVSVPITNCSIESTNGTAAIAGAGTIRYGGLVFTNTATNITTTTQTVLNEGPSRTIGTGTSGGTNTLTVTNSSNTASSNAAIVATVGGTSAADAYYQAVVSGTTSWTWGVDNSDSDAFVLSANAALGTTNVMRVSTAGEINYALQPAFFAYLNTGVNNVTGDTTEYTVIFDTEVYDQGGDFTLASSTFTAPVTGRYFLQFASLLSGGTVITGSNTRIVTSNRTYNNTMYYSPGSTAFVTGNIQVMADMDAADTATFTVATTDSGGKVDDITGVPAGQLRTYVTGLLEV